MPNAADIQKAAHRVKEGTDIISAILKMKKEAHQAMSNGNAGKLKEAGHKVFSFNASTI